jgi:hypothetical protein
MFTSKLNSTVPSGAASKYYSGTVSSGAGFTLPEPILDAMIKDAYAAIASFDNTSIDYKSAYGTIREDNLALYLMADFEAEGVRGNFGVRYISTDAESDYFGFSGGRESAHIGTNAKLSEIQAAVGLAVLDSWQTEYEEWEKARALSDIVAGKLGLGQSSVIPQGAISPYWIVSHQDSDMLLRIERACLGSKIETRKWWARGCHSMPAFVGVSTSPIVENFRQTDHVAQRYLGLPLYRGISEKSVEFIGRIIEHSMRL